MILYKRTLAIANVLGTDADKTNSEERNTEMMKRVENITDDLEILKSGVVATSLDDNMKN